MPTIKNIEPVSCSAADALHRRNFLKLAAGSAAALAATGTLRAQAADTARLAIGLDAHSMRSMRWKAQQLIAYAAENRLDAVSFNSLNLIESLDTAHLVSLRETAKSHGMRLYLSVGSISEKSGAFSNKYGNAEALLAEGIRVATALGSPVVNVRIGSVADRYTEGGIEAHIAASAKVLKALRHRAQDAGIKFGFEDHAGDLRSDELLGLIGDVGTDICGVMLDVGNALWAMEDPMKHFQTLGTHVVCTSIRDYMAWESEEGATVQWTAIGQGMMDVPAFIQGMQKMCPGVPFLVESISNSPHVVPYLTPEFWKGYPRLWAADIADFLALCRRGHPLEVIEPPAGMDKKTFDQQQQRAEFEASIAFLRSCRAGVNR